MHSAKRPHLLNKRGRFGEVPKPTKRMSNALDDLHLESSQDRVGRDGLDVDNTTADTVSTLSEGLLEPQDAPSRKNRKQLTSTEYALQEIRNRVRAIDERWEEVNVRATNTLENIAEDDLDERDPGRKRRESNPIVDKRREAARRFSLRGTHERPPANLLERSHATAWAKDVGDSGRAIMRDERVAMALAQSHENLAAAAVRFEESQDRSSTLLGGLRGWLDSFTGTSRPEDINPIAAMLPEPGLEGEVVALMTDCQDAALMLEHSTNRHTEQLREIFGQAGKLYGSEIEKVQKKGFAASGVAREKIASLQQHASKVEDLLKSMQDERATLHHKFSGAEQRCRWLEERYREDKSRLQEGISNYSHQVMQLQHVVAGYEDKARRQEQIEREPRLAPLLDALKAPGSGVDAEQLRHLQAETTRLASENAELTEANKKMYRDLVVSRLAGQGVQRSGGRRASTIAPVELEAMSTTSVADAAAEEMLRNAREKTAAAEKALLESKRKNETLATRLKTLSMELEKDQKKATVINHPATDAVEEGLRGAMRDLRRQSSGQLSGEVEARRKAVSELEAALKQAQTKEIAAAEANAELEKLRSELTKTQEEVQALHESAAAAKKSSDALSTNSVSPPTTDPPPPAAPEPVAASPRQENHEQVQVLSPVDYDGLVSRAVSREEEGLSQLRRKAADAGVAQRHRDKADKVFSDVVDCCGEGLSSVEQILEGTETIADDDASGIQEALAAALERAIASASVLLREALVGRVRACEAEKQASLQQQAAEEERVKAENLCQEKMSLADELQQSFTQASALRQEVAALRKDAEEAKKQPRHPQQEDGEEGQVRRHSEEHEGDTVVRVQPPPQEPPAVDVAVAPSPPPTAIATSPPSQPDNVGDSAMWRRRYEHLAGLLAEQTQRSSGKADRVTTPTRTRPSSGGSTTIQQEPRPPSVTATSTSSIGVQGDAAATTKPSVVVDGSSNTTPRPPPSLATEATSLDTKGERNAETAPPVALVSTGVSASDVPPSAGSHGEGPSVSAETVGTATEHIVGTTKKSSRDSGIQGESDVSGSGVIAGTTRKSSRDSGIQVESEPVLIKASDGGPPVTQIGDGVGKDPQIQEGSVSSNAHLNNIEQAAKQTLPSVEPSNPPSIDVEVTAANSTTSSTSAAVPTDKKSNDTTQGQEVEEDVGNIVDNKGPLDDDATAVEEAGDKASSVATEVEGKSEDGGERDARLSVPETGKWEEEAEDSTLMGCGEHQDASGMETKEEEEQGAREEEEVEQQLQECRDEDGGNGDVIERTSTETGWSSSPKVSSTGTTTVAVVDDANVTHDGRERYESLDGEMLLGKLLDDSAPSAVFEDDHQKLLQKLMRVRDDEHARNEAAARSPSSSSASSLSASCAECPTLREELAARSADAENAKEQQWAAQEELEASEHRVHVMTADMASLQRKIAEQADVIRHGRALADKVIAAPHVELPQVQAAQDFKELSAKVAHTRGDSRGKRSAKGQAAAAASRAGRVGGGGRSKSPPPPSLHGGGRKGNSLVLPVGGNGGRQRRQLSRSNSNSSSSSQHRRVSRRSSSKSSSSDNNNKRSAKREAVHNTTKTGKANESRAQTLHAQTSSEVAPIPSSKEKTAAEKFLGQSDQQEESKSPREGTTSEEMEVLDAAVDPVVVGDDRQDAAATNSKEVALGIGSSEDDAAGAAPATETNQQQDASGAETSRVEGTPTSTTATIDVITPVASPPLHEDTSRTTMCQDEDGSGPVASSSSTTQGDSDQTNPQLRRQDQPEQRSDSTADALEPTTAIAQLPMVTEAQSQGREITEESYRISLLSPKTSSAEDEENIDLVVKIREGDDKQESGLEPETEETQQPVSTAVVEFVPTERSLAAYCQAAARCKLAIEVFETRSESSFGSNSSSREKDETHQRLIEHYAVLTDTMMDWGVEAAQALLVEVTTTAAKHRTISAWTTAVVEPGGVNSKKRGGVIRGASARSLQSMHARQGRAALLMAQKAVLEEVVQAFGGWEPAVFLNSGVVNLDVDVAAWPIEDQVAILTALNGYLRDELEDDRTKHEQALGGILGRLQATQKELEDLRSNQEVSASDLKSPEATPEANTAEDVVQEVVLHSLPESDKEDRRPSENGTDTEDSEVNDSLSEGKEDRKKEGEARSGIVSATMPSPVQDEAAEEAMREANKSLQMQLTISIAALRKAKEDLRKEKERSVRAEHQLQSQQLQEPEMPEQKSLPQVQPLPTATPKPTAPIPAVPAPMLAPETPPPQLQVTHQPPPPEAQYQPPPRPRVTSKKGLDLIAQADLAERRAREKEEARLRAGYPLAALAMERKAIADLRAALIKAVCAILELCQQEQQPDPPSASGDGDGSCMIGRLQEGSACREGDPRANATRGPPSTLVQMVCSGEDANVRCATSEYMLSTGTAASRCSTAVGYGSSVLGGKAAQDRVNISTSKIKSKVATSGGDFQPAPSSSREGAEPGAPRSRLQEISKTVAESGTMARTLLSGFCSTGTRGNGDGRGVSSSTNLPSPAIVPPPTNPREALSVARATTADVSTFLKEIKVDIGAEPQIEASQIPPFDNGSGPSWRAPAAPKERPPTKDNGGGAEEVDTTASTRIANAVRGDVLWAESLPAFVRNAMEAKQGDFGQLLALKEREIVILTETQQKLKRDLRSFKADYVSADAEDVIRALRKRQRGLNNQVGYLERQLELAQQSSEVEGGAIEVLEEILRKRDTDKQLRHSLGLKSLEIGLKIQMLETDAGGKTVEVSRMSRKEQRAVAHLKERLVKERGIADARKQTVADELERSLTHGMRAFERVSRTIQRLCNGYTSLPGLLEWGRITAARLESTTAEGSRCGLGGEADASANSTRGSLHAPSWSGVGAASDERGFVPLKREATAAAPRTWGSGNQDRLADRVRGPGGPQPGSASGIGSMGNHRTPSSTYLGGTGLRSPEHRLGGGVSTVFSDSGSAFTNSLPGRMSNTITPSVDTPAAQEKSYYRPKKDMGAGGRHGGEGYIGDLRKGAWTAGHTSVGGSSSCGVLCAPEYGHGGRDLSSLGSYRSGGGGGADGGSSVASLLREDRAFKRRSGAPHGSREAEERDMARGHANTFVNNYHNGVPALVPLNNVGLPVRLRRQPRTQGR